MIHRNNVWIWEAFLITIRQAQAGMVNPILDYHTFISVCEIYEVDADVILLEKFKILCDDFAEYIDKNSGKNNDVNDACKDCFDIGKAGKNDRNYCKRKKCTWFSEV